MRGRILIVDDEEDMREILSQFLNSEGYVVAGKACDGIEACELNDTLKPDLILLDVEMPGMDGIQAARKIMEKRPVPIVICTECREQRLLDQAAEIGVYGILFKPLRLSDLLPALTVAISRYREVSGMQKDVARLQEALEVRKWIEKAKGILMRTQGINEEEAHRYLQVESQRRSEPVGNLARAIVTADEILKINILGEVRDTCPRTGALNVR